MSAKGKKNTVNLQAGDIIMVRRVIFDDTLATPSPTKRQEAEAMAVAVVKPIRVGKRQRLAYDISGTTEQGTMLWVRGVGGNQTFWLAS